MSARAVRSTGTSSSEWMKIFVATALGFPILLVIIDLTDHLQTLSRPEHPARRHRAELRLLDAAVDVHGDAGGRAVRDGVLDRHLHAALRGHGGEGVGHQLLPPDRAHPARRHDRGRARPRHRRDGPHHRRAAQRRCCGESKISAGTQRDNFAYAGEYGRVYKALNARRDAGRARPAPDRTKGQRARIIPTVLISVVRRQVRAATTAAKWSLGDTSGRDARRPGHARRTST